MIISKNVLMGDVVLLGESILDDDNKYNEYMEKSQKMSILSMLTIILLSISI